MVTYIALFDSRLSVSSTVYCGDLSDNFENDALLQACVEMGDIATVGQYMVLKPDGQHINAIQYTVSDDGQGDLTWHLGWEASPQTTDITRWPPRER